MDSWVTHVEYKGDDRIIFLDSYIFIYVYK